MSLVDRLMNRLQREALAGDGHQQWRVMVRPGTLRVEAVTRQVADDPEGAFALALRLRDGMVAEGFELVDRCRLGATAAGCEGNGHGEGRGPDPDPDATGPEGTWRGWVDVGLRPAGLRWPREPLP